MCYLSEDCFRVKCVFDPSSFSEIWN